MRCFYSQ